MGPDPAVVHVHGRRGAPLLGRQPACARRLVRVAARPCDPARAHPDPARHLPSLAGTAADLLHLRGRPHQIGLGYVVLFLLAHARPRTQWIAAGVILFATWLAFVLYPLPPAGYDTALVGVPADWPHHLRGFAAHWDKNTNLANRVDQWFLNLFPRESPFVYNRGGYTTLNFLPSLATLIFGLLAGELLRGADSARDRLRRLAAYGVAGIALGAVLHFAGVCPLVKRIWTPSWAIFSAGWAALFLAFFFYVVDVRGWRRWTLPFLVVGMNSIAMYVIVHVAERYTAEALRTHLGKGTFQLYGAAYEPILVGGTSLLIFWLMLYWMYRRKIFIRI